jgi:hypothetical protein
MGAALMPVIRPAFTRRSILYTVQRIANEISADHAGKVPDVFHIDARIKAELMKDPNLLDLDKAARFIRKFWERANNETINRKLGGSLFVPGAYVPVGKRIKGQMKNLDPIADLAAWLQKDKEAQDNFNNTINWRQERKLKIIDEASRHRDCKTWGDLESKLRGWAPSPADEQIFGADADEDDDTES